MLINNTIKNIFILIILYFLHNAEVGLKVKVFIIFPEQFFSSPDQTLQTTNNQGTVQWDPGNCGTRRIVFVFYVVIKQILLMLA